MIKKLFIILLLATLGHAGETPQNHISLKDIPGITEQEAKAVAEFQEQSRTFVYGMLHSTEAFVDINGNINGFGAMFCELLTDIFGTPFVLKFYEWDELIAGLASGEVDFTGEMTATDERRKTYFMTDPIAIRTVKRFRLDDGSNSEGNVAKTRNMRYAFLSETVTAGEVKATSDKPFEIIWVDNYEEAYAKLKSGEADAFFDENTAESVFDTYDNIVSEYFFPLLFSEISLTTQNENLQPIISIVQKMLQNGGSKYLSELYKQGNQVYKRVKLFNSLTKEELAYVNSGIPVKFLAEYDNYPTSFYNKREREWQGIAMDIVKEIEALAGLKFEIINDKFTPWSELQNMLERGEGSMISELIYTPERAERFIWAEKPFTIDYVALLSKADFKNISIDEIFSMKVGAVRNIMYANMFRKWFQSHTNFIEYDGTDKLFDALGRGEIDLAMSSRNQLLYLTNYLELLDFKVNYQFDYPFSSTFGFYKGDSTLQSIMDKAIRQIDMKTVSGHWLHKTYDYKSKLAQEKLFLYLGICALLFCVLTLGIALYINHKAGKRLEHEVQMRTAELYEQSKKLEYISMTDQLTDMPNRRSFDKQLNLTWRASIRNKTPVSFLMMDIDKFKTYNDTHGHQQGDTLLQEVAECIIKNMKRPGDFAARWGGEEFAALLSNTNIKGAVKVAESIRKSIEDLGKITISIGVNALIPESSSSLDNFISAADDALYKAKAMGRNKVFPLTT